ncbi:MAG: hypothetical protein Q7T30_01435 [Planctomycetota bacterium]|nr:hypothetical protein [Planctomycetota bacterium]
MDVDLLVDTRGDNEARVLEAVATLKDGAAREIVPGEIARWIVVRIADEIVVDLMKSACGVDYCQAEAHIDQRLVDGVTIPFASPVLLWRMKKPTRREKDLPDLHFLRRWFQARGQEPPELRAGSESAPG